MLMKKAYIILQNGRVFEGKSFGAEGRVVGEIVFATGMTGYLEALTDPSYYGQILVQTFPLVGNYGVIPEDFESEEIHVNAYIVREQCEFPSNYRCQGTLDAWLKKNSIVGVYDVDTRALTEIIREYGVMNAIITDSLPEPLVPDEVLTYSVRNAVMSVTSKEKELCPAENRDEALYNIALYDFGTKRNIIRSLQKRNCNVTILPANTPASEVLEGGYDGVMLSNGPGDPKENVEIVLELRKLIGKIPIFGICLGHQLLALAAGAVTTKLKYGHRGANQPVKDLKTGRIYITSQNHGYAVDASTLPDFASLRFVNVNEGTVEGIDYAGKYAYTAQFHPEACAGPKDSDYMFDEFMSLIEEFKNKDRNYAKEVN